MELWRISGASQATQQDQRRERETPGAIGVVLPLLDVR